MKSRQFLRFSRMLIKRHLHHLFFLMLLLLIPVMAFFLHTEAADTESTQIRVALTFQNIEENSFLQGVQDSLLTDTDSMFTFYLCPDQDTLTNDVAAGKAECGFFFPDSLLEKLTDQRADRQILAYASSTTTLMPIAQETVYAALFQQYEAHLLLQYLQEDASFTQLSATQLSALLTKHLTDGSVFEFTYQTTGAAFNDSSIAADSAGRQEKTSYVLAPFRGFLALLIFLSGFCGALQYDTDRKKQLFLRFSYRSALLCRLTEIAIPVLLASIMAFLAIAAWENGSLLLEGAALLLLGTLTTLFCFLLSWLIKNRTLFTATIPVLMLCCLIFTPIILDAVTFVPVIRILRYLFVPYYYLRLF